RLILEKVDRPDAMGEAIRRHRAEVDCVIVAGGDGSVNTALGALMETGLPLGVVPLGTASDFARTLGIPPDVGGACDVIAGGLAHRVDVGCVNGQYFLNASSLGLSVWIAENLHPEQ